MNQPITRPVDPLEGATQPSSLATAAASPLSKTDRSLQGIIDREHARARRRRVIAASAIVALVLAIAGTAVALRPRPVPFGARFRSLPATHGDVVRVVRATGHVEALTTVLIGAELSGRIGTVEVDFNDPVKVGQVLARFDRDALNAQRMQVEATVTAARAAVTQARLDLAQAQRNRARSNALFGKGAQTEAEHEQAVSAELLSQARLAAAQAQLLAQEAAWALARTNLEHAVVRSPIDGVVITRNVDPGQTVASMLQTPVLFTVAADLKRMRVIAAIDEADIAEVKVGQTATFSVTAYPTRTFEGTVTEVRNSPAVVQDVVTYGAIVEVLNPDLALKPGMTASVKVRTAQAMGVDRVPNAALHFVPPKTAREEGAAVFVLKANALERIPLEVGISDGEQTQVLRGLTVGTEVVVELTPQGKKAYELDHQP